MTPEDHNKALGICHLVYGGFSTLMMVAVLCFIAAMGLMLPPSEGPPAGFILLFLTLLMIWSFIFTLPSYIAGYAILKRKTWARTAGIVAAVVETMSFPFGTAVAVYSFWFMFSDAGRAMYDNNFTRPHRPYELRDTPPSPFASDWNARAGQERAREYVPPAQPPDWRNE
ncbi:MAG TPA: hypothetical protein VGB61_08570 [Pyrinomonadaceae bacterium]|jgi:hypothetical protein